jgi:hypothetical protein
MKLKFVRLALLALLSIAALAAKADCPFAPTCPLDGAQLMRTGTEYSGIKAIGIYSHHVTSGGSHTYRIPCN